MNSQEEVPLSLYEKPPEAETSDGGVTKDRGCPGSGEGANFRDLAGNLKSEGKQLARSGEAILPPPKEVESERETDLAEVPQPVLGIMISPLAFL